MDTPLEIVFHNMPSSPNIESDVRKRAAKLDRLYGHLVGCRVSVEQLHRRHHTGNLYDVHIDLRVPGDELVVSHEPHHPREKFADPDLGIALRNAFKAAERQLLDFKRRQRGEVKLHDASFAGQVSQLYPEEDYGFILTHEGTQLYFPPQQPDAARFQRIEGRRPSAFRRDGRRYRSDRDKGVAGGRRAGLAETKQPLPRPRERLFCLGITRGARR